MSSKAVYKVARLEFVRVLANPIVLLAGLVVIVLSYIDVKSGVVNGALVYTNLMRGADAAVLQGFMQTWQSTGMICTILIAFLGATSIPYDKWSGSVNVLLVKPLYRRDFVLGKFLGLALFALLFITFAMLFSDLLVVVLFPAPFSVSMCMWHIAVAIVIFTLTCWTVLALNALFGIVSRSVLFVTAAAMTYYFLDWIWYGEIFFGSLSALMPQKLYWRAGQMLQGGLFDSPVSFSQWFSYAIPYLAALLIELAVLLLTGVLLFSRDEST